MTIIDHHCGACMRHVCSDLRDCEVKREEQVLVFPCEEIEGAYCSMPLTSNLMSILLGES